MAVIELSKAEWERMKVRTVITIRLVSLARMQAERTGELKRVAVDIFL
jgi:hypothetical protein